MVMSDAAVIRTPEENVLEVRCSDCRKLVAMMDARVLVIRCARCKREIRIAMDGSAPRSGYVPCECEADSKSL